MAMPNIEPMFLLALDSRNLTRSQSNDLLAIEILLYKTVKNHRSDSYWPGGLQTFPNLSQHLTSSAYLSQPVCSCLIIPQPHPTSHNLTQHCGIDVSNNIPRVGVPILPPVLVPTMLRHGLNNYLIICSSGCLYPI